MSNRENLELILQKVPVNALKGRRLVNVGKMALLTPTHEAWKDSVRKGAPFAYINFVAYPKLCHVKTFESANMSVRLSGPASRWRGSVGSIELIPGEDREGKRVLFLDHVQAHFKTGTELHDLPRSLATYYGGWRRSALEHLVRMARENRTEVQIPIELITRNQGTSPFGKELFSVCTNLGVQVVNRAGHLVLNP